MARAGRLSRLALRLGSVVMDVRNATLVAAVVLLVLAGCGSNDDNAADDAGASEPAATTVADAANDEVIEQAENRPEVGLTQRAKEIEAILIRELDGYRPGPEQFPTLGHGGGGDCYLALGPEAIPETPKDENHILRGPTDEDSVYVDAFPWATLADCLITARKALGW